jgi:hypothetical protein
MIVDELCSFSIETVVLTIVSIEDFLMDGKARLLIRGSMAKLVELNMAIRQIVDLGTMVLYPEMLKVIENEHSDLDKSIGIFVDSKFDSHHFQTIPQGT